MSKASWRSVRLGDVIELFDQWRIPLNSRERLERSGPYPYYGAQGIIDSIDDFIFDGDFILLAEDGENLNSRKLPLALKATGKFWVNNHAHILRGLPGVIDDGFLLAALNNADVKPYVTGAAQPKLSQGNLRLIELLLPPLPRQRRIAGILAAYDDLIENCERRIRVLDEMARTLYREWFVLFRYPGYEKVPLVDSPLGRIPKGWRAATLSSVTSFIHRGISPSYDDEGPSTVINQKCVRDQRLDMSPARRQNKPIPEDRRVRAGDVIVNSTGVGTLGRVAQVLEDLGACTADTHVTIIRADDATDSAFFGAALLALQPTFERKGVGATGQTELSRKAIGEVTIAVPPTERQREYAEVARPIRAESLNLQKQASNLRRTRNLLLPRLLSGQLSVEDA